MENLMPHFYIHIPTCIYIWTKYNERWLNHGIQWVMANAPNYFHFPMAITSTGAQCGPAGAVSSQFYLLSSPYSKSPKSFQFIEWSDRDTFSPTLMQSYRKRLGCTWNPIPQNGIFILLHNHLNWNSSPLSFFTGISTADELTFLNIFFICLLEYFFNEMYVLMQDKVNMHLRLGRNWVVSPNT